MLDLKTSTIDAVEREMLNHPNVGGLIYFARHFESAEQISELSKEIRSIRQDIIVAVDQEGGRVQRFKEGFTRLPAMATLGRLFAQDSIKAKQYASQLGWLMAAEMQSVGVDISFAPVLDMDYGTSDVIGDRAFSSNPDTIGELAVELIKGMRQAGMASTGKHFPGHGYVAEDSHIAKPVDTRSLGEIEAQDLKPFKILMDAGLDAVMPAHVVYSAVDDMPAGFSSVWINNYLRKTLNFDGVVFSDDLSMDGAFCGEGSDHVVGRANLALKAGCDMVLVCNDACQAEILVEQLNVPDTWTPRRLQRMLGEFKYNDLSVLKSQPEYAAAQAAVDVLNQYQ